MALTQDEDYLALASYRKCAERIRANWQAFVALRSERLGQALFDAPVEKIAENILEDLFTVVLDWQLSDVNLQIGRADIILSDLGIKRLVLEAKRPGTLAWNRPSVTTALEQAWRYAAEQKVGTVAVSDGSMLYAADVHDGGLRDRLLVGLASLEPQVDLWWLSTQGIYRARPQPVDAAISALDVNGAPGALEAATQPSLLHPKYQLPAPCFAYIGDANRPTTWKLPFRQSDGSVDLKRLPKAIQAILSNYRGARVTIPRESAGDVLVRLARAAASLGKMPCQAHPAADAYVEAHHALEQLDRLSEVGCCTSAPLKS